MLVLATVIASFCISALAGPLPASLLAAGDVRAGAFLVRFGRLVLPLALGLLARASVPVIERAEPSCVLMLFAGTVLARAMRRPAVTSR